MANCTIFSHCSASYISVHSGEALAAVSWLWGHTGLRHARQSPRCAGHVVQRQQKIYEREGEMQSLTPFEIFILRGFRHVMYLYERGNRKRIISFLELLALLHLLALLISRWYWRSRSITCTNKSGQARVKQAISNFWRNNFGFLEKKTQRKKRFWEREQNLCKGYFFQNIFKEKIFTSRDKDGNLKISRWINVIVFGTAIFHMRIYGYLIRNLLTKVPYIFFLPYLVKTSLHTFRINKKKNSTYSKPSVLYVHRSCSTANSPTRRPQSVDWRCCPNPRMTT